MGLPLGPATSFFSSCGVFKLAVVSVWAVPGISPLVADTIGAATASVAHPFTKVGGDGASTIAIPNRSVYTYNV